MVRFSPLPSVFFGSALASLGLAAPLAAGSAIDMTLPFAGYCVNVDICVVYYGHSFLPVKPKLPACSKRAC